MQSTAQLPDLGAALLRPCPFCGGGATLEPDPWQAESVRIACGNSACRVLPRTEYLLVCFADELVEAWNGRPAAPAPATEHTRAARQGQDGCR